MTGGPEEGQPRPADQPWQRLDPRKLLLDPVRVVGQFALPALVAVVGVSTTGGGMPGWMLPLVVLGAVVLGAVPWLTTFYRITETQFQQRSGLLNKTTSSAPLDRVRSVDLEASLLHRVLGLAKVQVGTGVDEDRITLDAVSRERAAQLRTYLLARRPGHEAPEGAAVPEPGPRAEQELARVDWAWLRFAPFSLARLVLVAGGVGVLAQFAEGLPLLDDGAVDDAWDWVRGFALAVVVAVLLVGGLAAWVAISVSGYVVQWWNLRLTRGDGTLHLSTGLFTTRSISVEEARVRGVEMREPLLLRLVGGGELSVLATGTGTGVTRILPPSPREVVLRVGDDVAGTPGTLAVPLTSHGPAARRRSWVRELAEVPFTVAAVAAATWFFDWSWWVPVVTAVLAVAGYAALAESSYRHLGHALTDDHLVAGGGQLTRVRTVLERDGIIGWVVVQSVFQRRAGLADLVATTAAGAEKVVLRDVPHDRALAVADTATPGMLAPFRA